MNKMERLDLVINPASVNAVNDWGHGDQQHPDEVLGNILIVVVAYTNDDSEIVTLLEVFYPLLHTVQECVAKMIRDEMAVELGLGINK